MRCSVSKEVISLDGGGDVAGEGGVGRVGREWGWMIC